MTCTSLFSILHISPAASHQKQTAACGRCKLLCNIDSLEHIMQDWPARCSWRIVTPTARQ